MSRPFLFTSDDTIVIHAGNPATSESVQRLTGHAEMAEAFKAGRGSAGHRPRSRRLTRGWRSGIGLLRNGGVEAGNGYLRYGRIAVVVVVVVVVFDSSVVVVTDCEGWLEPELVPQTGGREVVFTSLLGNEYPVSRKSHLLGPGLSGVISVPTTATGVPEGNLVVPGKPGLSLGAAFTVVVPSTEAARMMCIAPLCQVFRRFQVVHGRPLWGRGQLGSGFQPPQYGLSYQAKTLFRIVCDISYNVR
jgi:hypothetical protein